MYAGYPLAHKAFGIAVVVFALYNLSSWLGAITALPLYVRWLGMSQPFTDAAAVVFPAIDSSTAFPDIDLLLPLSCRLKAAAAG